ADPRGQAGDVTLGLIATASQRGQLFDRDLEAYVDVVAEPAKAGSARPDWPTSGSPYAAMAPMGARNAPPESSLSGELLWSAPPDSLDPELLVQDLARLMPMLVAELVAGGSSDVRCGGAPVPTYLNP